MLRIESVQGKCLNDLATRLNAEPLYQNVKNEKVKTEADEERSSIPGEGHRSAIKGKRPWKSRENREELVSIRN